MREVIEAATGAKVRRIETVAVEGDVSWVVAELDDGRWAATDDAEISPGRVSIHPTREEAIAYQRSGWIAAGGDAGGRVRWVGPDR